MTKGRSRRQGVTRYSEGRIMAAEYRQEDPRALNIANRQRDYFYSTCSNPHMETPWGRMFIMRLLTAPRFEAASRWADNLAAYDHFVLGKRRTPAPQGFERVGLTTGDAADDPERIERFRQRFNADHEALLAAGKDCEAAVNRFCRSEGMGAGGSLVMRGLDVLAEHFGLSVSKKKKRA